ncbi:MAG TPA: hypothetical protein VG028_05470 [Terriglobia bacterium]|nr:hypothetical protein [Terriglobia bacterium]
MAAPIHTVSGSRFLRPKLSRFFNRVAQAQPKITRFVEGAAELMPPMPDIFSSIFYTRPRAESPLAATKPRTASDSIFLQPKMLSRFFNQAVHVPRRTSGAMKGTASLMPPMPDMFSSQFFGNPKTPPTPPKSLRSQWKPKGPGGFGK